MALLRFLLAMGAAWIVGVTILSRLARQPRSLPGLLGLAFFTGALAIGLWMYLLLWVGVPATPLTVGAGALALALSGRWAALREAVWNKPPLEAWLLLPAAAFLVYGALSWPLLGADPENFYVLKAKSIVHQGSMWTQDFLDTSLIHPAHRRVLLLPCIYATVGMALGDFPGQAIRLWMTLMQIGALLGMYDVLRARTERTAAALGTALYAWVPALWHDSGGAVTGYADAPLAMIFLFALATEKPLAVFMMAAGVLLKDDAAAFLLAFLLFRGPRATALPVAVTAAWMATGVSALPFDSDYYPQWFLRPNPGQIPFILRKLGGEVVSLKHWSLLWPIMITIVAFRMRRVERADLPWLVPVGLQLLAYIFVWQSFPGELGKFSVRMQDMRLLLHVTPILWTWTVWRAAPVPGPAAEGSNS